MGYSTDFIGYFNITPKLKKEHRKYLKVFSETRRMKRDINCKDILEKDDIRLSVGLPIGEDGGFFVGGRGFMGQDKDSSISDYNIPPKGQPGLWCQWTPNKNGTRLIWNGAEKFYYYIQWLDYIIQTFVKPWGYELNGDIVWTGEDMGDVGKIMVEDNVMIVKNGKIVF